MGWVTPFGGKGKETRNVDHANIVCQKECVKLQAHREGQGKKVAQNKRSKHIHKPRIRKEQGKRALNYRREKRKDP